MRFVGLIGYPAAAWRNPRIPSTRQSAIHGFQVIDEQEGLAVPAWEQRFQLRRFDVSLFVDQIFSVGRDIGGGGYDVTRDGRFLLVNSTIESATPLTLVSNWDAELRK